MQGNQKSKYNREKDFSVRPGKGNEDLKKNLNILAKAKKRSLNELVQDILVIYVEDNKEVAEFYNV